MPKETSKVTTQGILPAPSFTRTGDSIHVSTLHPVDNMRNLAHSRSTSPYFGESEVAAQARSILESLKAVLQEAGSSLDKTLKAEVYLSDPQRFLRIQAGLEGTFPHRAAGPDNGHRWRGAHYSRLPAESECRGPGGRV